MSKLEVKTNKVFPALVARVLDDATIVINKGSDNGIKLGQRFLIYSVTDKEIIDPATNEALGYLENPKGTGKVTHVQEKISIIASDRKYEREYPIRFTGETETKLVSEPFKNPKVADLAKPI
jgi:hypothetical protein